MSNVAEAILFGIIVFAGFLIELLVLVLIAAFCIVAIPFVFIFNLLFEFVEMIKDCFRYVRNIINYYIGK